MQEIKNEELKSIVGGRSISGAIISSFNSLAKTIFSLGQAFGSAIRRITTKKLCGCYK